VNTERHGSRTAIVFSGGGARGAYEAGVLSVLWERVFPQLPAGREFDVVSGTSVGSIHAAYVAATSHLPPAERAAALLETWRGMALRDVLALGAADLVGVPLRMLGASWGSARVRRGAAVLGGLVDISPLERVVDERIPWASLAENLAAGRPGALCVTCTAVSSGKAVIFMDGPLVEAGPWQHDVHARAVAGPLSSAHVRASAAIPFLFPAVQIGEHFYVDGGLRQNTPLSPPVRLRADRIVVISVRHAPEIGAEERTYAEQVITQPAFLLGKVLDALLLDQLEAELQRIELINAILERGREICGDEFRTRLNTSVRELRGVGLRPIETCVIRPSEDLGRLAADCWKRSGGIRALGTLAGLAISLSQVGVPADEADLLSYLYFDRGFTAELVELGRQDALRQADALLELLLGGG